MKKVYEGSLYESYNFPVSVKLFQNLNILQNEASKMVGGHHNFSCSFLTPLLFPVQH